MQLLVAAAVLLASTPLTAGAARSPDAFRAPDAYYAAVASRIHGLEQAAAGQAEIDRHLRREFGWVAQPMEPAAPARPDGLAALASSASNVIISKPLLYWDMYARRYQVYVTWTWRTCDGEPCYGDDVPRSGNVGGQDGFGVQVSRSLPPIWTHLQAFNGHGAVTNYTTPETHNQGGATFSEQDILATYHDLLSYTWHHGSIIWAFGRPSCRPGQYWTFNAKMAHTWSSTALTSFTVSIPAGIQATFSSTEDNWFGAGPSPYNWYPCGH